MTSIFNTKNISLCEHYLLFVLFLILLKSLKPSETIPNYWWLIWNSLKVKSICIELILEPNNTIFMYQPVSFIISTSKDSIVLAHMNYSAPVLQASFSLAWIKVIIEKSHGGRFLWNRNWDLGWIWAGWHYWKKQQFGPITSNFWGWFFQVFMGKKL